MSVQDRIAELEKRVDKLERRASVLDSSSATAGAIPPPSRKEKAINEFMRDFQHATDGETILGVGYYLEVHEVHTVLNINDLRDGLNRAGLKRVKNITDVCNKLVSKGWYSLCKDKKEDMKAWVLTQTGIEEVQARSQK